MTRNKRMRDPVPKHFGTVDEAGQFWNDHDLADYADLTRGADFEVDLKRRVFLTSLEPELAKKLTTVARTQGISTETLINVWLTEKIEELANK